MRPAATVRSQFLTPLPARTAGRLAWFVLFSCMAREGQNRECA